MLGVKAAAVEMWARAPEHPSASIQGRSHHSYVMLQRLLRGKSASGIASPNPQRAKPAVPNLRVPSAAPRDARAWGTPSAWHFQPRDPAPPSCLLPFRHPEQGEVPARPEAGRLQGEENHFKGLIEKDKSASTRCRMGACK